MSDIRITRGDTAQLIVSVLDEDGVTPLDLSGVNMWFTAKLRVDDEAPIIIQKTSAQGGGISYEQDGKAVVTLEHDDTASLPPKLVALPFDIQIDANGVISTVASGRLIVRPDVTTATVI